MSNTPTSDRPDETLAPLLFHCVVQLDRDRWEYRLKDKTDAPNEDDLVFASELAEERRLSAEKDAKLADQSATLARLEQEIATLKADRV